MSKFIIFQPGLQHSHQLALALYEHGLLKKFWSGVPVLNKGNKTPNWLLSFSLIRSLKVVPIPSEYKHHSILFPLLFKLGSKLPTIFGSKSFNHRVCHLFDWWVSKYIKMLRPKVVIAYENSAYNTFREAKRIGALCVLDAASFHYECGQKLSRSITTRFSKKIDELKALEIEMADLILTCSPLALESYKAAGVPDYKLKAVLLGSDIPILRKRDFSELHNRPLRFLFAGALSKRKSIDIILDVFRRLHQEGHDVEVSFVGGVAESNWLAEILETPNASYQSNLPQSELFSLLEKVDCLLLPSRFDSFGMVVAESMACGTPAIVSTQTGAKAIIEAFPKSGWIVDANAESLYDCIKARIIDREGLFVAREYARAAALHFTWKAYRERVGQLLNEFVN